MRLAPRATTIGIFCLVIFAVFQGICHAQGDVLWGALILATNSEHPQPPPAELRAQAANLHMVFGYNQFRLLGQKRKEVPTGREDWLVSSRQFFLRVDTEKPIPGGYDVALQLVKESKVLVEAKTQLERDRPLFIRGPFVGKGQLIILLTVL
jgi:hypothetical protein